MQGYRWLWVGRCLHSGCSIPPRPESMISHRNKLIALTILACFVTGVPVAHALLPHEVSGSAQYTETLPAAGGGEPTGGSGRRGDTDRPPAEALGKSNAEALESLGRDEPVLAPVLLAGSLVARRCGDGELDLGHPFEQHLLERAFAGAGSAGDDEDQRLSGGRGQSAQTVAGRRGLPPSSTD